MQTQKGFSLIELMIVIAIIGILASVAVPQYQDYVLRTDATNTLSVARPLQLAVGEYAARYSRLPPAASDLSTYTGVSTNATDHKAGKVASIAVGTNGVLTVTFDTVANGVPAKLAGLTYTLTPTIASNGVVTWASSAGTLPVQYLPKTK